MKKNITKKQQVSVNLPEIVDIDELSYASDDELIRRVTHLVGDRDRAARAGYTLDAWEVEICYVQRELKIRQDRRVAHDKYLASHGEFAHQNNDSYVN